MYAENGVNCERCSVKAKTITMSWFNIQMICNDCDKKELNHKDIDKAKSLELEQVKKGNYNYMGMCLPNDL